ncbi:hypothetical protein FGRMN_763 [Fusarium graminum]|nr:hypothetical protein FGRMN_763 [Fusarium graminum]
MMATDQRLNNASTPKNPVTAIPRLDSLLLGLTLADLLYLRSRIDGLIANVPRLDDFPIEIIRNILSNLDYDAYLNCTRTSKGWRNAWTHKDVWIDVLNYFFPGLRELYPHETAYSLYSNARQLHLKWRQPYCDYTWKPWSSISPGVSPRTVAYPFLYNKGKFVWQHGPYTFNVGSFVTGQWQQLIQPGAAMRGDRYQAAAVSDKLLVVYMVTREIGTVFVAHLATEVWKRLRLPTRLHHAYADSETVIFVAQTGKILQFTWGGNLVELDSTHIDRNPSDHDSMLRGIPKILTHPTNYGIIYAVWAYSHKFKSNRLFSFVIAKFEDGRSAWDTTKSISIQNPLRNPHSDCQDYSWTAVSFTCQKSDSHGTFCLGFYRIQGAETDKPVLCPCCLPRTRRGNWGAVTFNVLTETFGHHEYLSPRPNLLWDGDQYFHPQSRNETRVVNAHVWNNSLVISTSQPCPGSGRRAWPNSDILDVQAIHPIGSSQASSSRCTAKRLSNFTQQWRTQVFQDDEFVIVPLVGGVVLCRPSEVPTDSINDDTVPADRDEDRPLLYSAWEVTELIELKHTEIGSGLDHRLERRGHEERNASLQV